MRQTIAMVRKVASADVEDEKTGNDVELFVFESSEADGGEGRREGEWWFEVGEEGKEGESEEVFVGFDTEEDEGGPAEVCDEWRVTEDGPYRPVSSIPEKPIDALGSAPPVGC